MFKQTRSLFCASRRAFSTSLHPPPRKPTLPPSTFFTLLSSILLKNSAEKPKDLSKIFSLNPELDHSASEKREIDSGLYRELHKLADQYKKDLFSIGAYSDSVGNAISVERMREYLETRDKMDVQKSKIVYQEAMIFAFKHVLITFLGSDKDAIVFEDPLAFSYKQMAKEVGYHTYSFFEKDFASGFKKQLERIKKDGKTAKFLFLTNPQTNTGKALSSSTVKSVLQLCEENGVVIFVDESTHQMTEKSSSNDFVSFTKVAKQHKIDAQIISALSSARSVFPLAGLTGSVLHFENFNEEVLQVFIKFASIMLCSNTLGQICTDLGYSHAIFDKENWPALHVSAKKDFERNLALIRNGDKLLSEFLSRQKLFKNGNSKGKKHDFGHYFFWESNKKFHGSEELVNKIAAETGVEIAFGEDLGVENNFLRVNKLFWREKPDLPKFEELLKNAVKN